MGSGVSHTGKITGRYDSENGNLTMHSERIEKWMSQALALREVVNQLPVPFHVLTGEAVDVARFFETHYAARRNAKGELERPGLELVARGELMYPQLGAEVLELQGALSDAQTAYLLTVQKESAAPVERADFVLSELTSALRFLFDDDVQDEGDAQLAALTERHAAAFSHDARAAGLDDFAGLAQRHRTALDGLGGFDAAVVDEARELAKRLREQSANKRVGEPANLQREALELRNRFASLLLTRMNKVRSAARFVFRSDPEIVRRVTSSYERKRRKASAKSRAADASTETVEA